MTAARLEGVVAEPISVKIPEAVRLTGISRSRIYELMRSGEIEFAKVGSSTLIIVESLRHFVDDHKCGAAPAGEVRLGKPHMKEGAAGSVPDRENGSVGS